MDWYCNANHLPNGWTPEHKNTRIQEPAERNSNEVYFMSPGLFLLLFIFVYCSRLHPHRNARTLVPCISKAQQKHSMHSEKNSVVVVVRVCVCALRLSCFRWLCSIFKSALARHRSQQPNKTKTLILFLVFVWWHCVRCCVLLTRSLGFFQKCSRVLICNNDANRLYLSNVVHK